MCGLAGILAADGNLPDSARASLGEALRRLRHRGPDDEGMAEVSAHQGPARGLLGHRRLSIIDVAGGHQPLASEDGATLVFNGEIYNFEDLRTSFRDFSWRTHSDTEVLFEVLKRDGIRGLSRLNGMFAFACWDPVAAELLLARDAGGEKPLYYSTSGGRLVFASELRAILALLGQTPHPDRAAVADYLQLGYIPSPASPFEGIRKLEPGQWLRWRNGRLETGQFFSPFDVATTSPIGTAALLGLLEDAVRSRLIGERPLGVFLSGGVDSTLVAALVARILGPEKTLSFSIGFDDPDFDESRYSQGVAKFLGTRHHHQVLSLAEVRNRLGDALLAQDEPNADSSIVPTFLLSQFAAKEITVSLGGDGGDELFAGYRTHALHRLMHLVDQVPGLAALVRGAGLAGSRAHWLIPRSPMAPVLRHLGSVGLYSRDEVAAWLPGPVGPTALEAKWREVAGGRGSDLDRILELDFRYYLGDNVLQKVDRASMAHSLEVRAPLLDRRLVDHALGLPSAGKIAGTRGKLPLRDVLSTLVPGKLWNQRKQGFSVPLARWFQEGLLDELRQSLQYLEFWGLPSAPAVLETAVAAAPSRAPHRLWALFALASFARRQG